MSDGWHGSQVAHDNRDAARIRDHAELAFDRLTTALTTWPTQSLIDGSAVRDLILDVMADLRPAVRTREERSVRP